MSLIPENISKITLSKSALQKNVHALQAVVGPKKTLCCVVKSDAYGHGLESVVPELVRLGQTTFAVSNVAEALWVRKHTSDARILVLIEPLARCVEQILAYRLEPVLNGSQDVLTYQQNQAAFELAGVRVHFKIDTGMGRLGLGMAEFQSVLKSLRLPKTQTAGLMTHFASSEAPKDPLTVEQVKRLKLVLTWAKEKHPLWEIHGANSAATLNGLVTEFTDLFRVGLALYGGIPDGRLSQVLQWESVVLHIRHISKGQSVGYGHTWVSARDARLAIVPVGYRLGYGLSQSNVGWVHVAGRQAPVVGRVSMDMITIDVTDHPMTDTKLLGQSVTVLSNDPALRTINSVFALADNAHTIPYEIFCGIHRGITRTWMD